jgi:NADP-dependent aldehyde dehydrogenase
MLKGYNGIGQTASAAGAATLQVFSTVSKTTLPEKFTVATAGEVEAAVAKAVVAFPIYQSLSPLIRAGFLETIADEIMALGDELIQRAMQETGLPEARLLGERGRTTNQLKMFATILREGSWLEAVIDTAQLDRKPLPRADLRKMLVPIGPVVVFGASNFPFAFSTAGGDTASALAAGNPVIVKAHSSHLGTNELMATAIHAAIEKCQLPDGVFSFVIGEGSVTGMQLVKHPDVKAVGFTGSYTAGMAIYKAATTERWAPIPVYAEMSSINPVLIFPDKLKTDEDAIAAALAGSITIGGGQFCTNPGLLFLINDTTTESFISKLNSLLSAMPGATMLNAGICKSYYKNKATISGQKGVKLLVDGSDASAEYKGTPALLEVSAADFIQNALLQNEIFGPASLIVKCEDEVALKQVISALHGQLTGSVFATNNDLTNFADHIHALTGKVGRVVYNNVPTGVEVCYAMVHGGPFPSTTDARSTSVGADAILRFVRPLCLQDCPQEFLPDALKNENPLNLMRRVNGKYTNEAI